MSSEVWMIDYGAGNVRSLVNAVQHLGFTLRIVQEPEDILKAEVDIIEND
jgi:glutamine amidotransferase/cyclase